MKTKYTFLLTLPILAAVALTLTGCSQQLSTVGAVENSNDSAGISPVVNFQTVKEKVFEPHCLSCHATDTRRGDIDLEQYATAFEVSMEIRAEVDADRMPRRAPPLSPELKALLFAWIDAGSPEL